MEKQARASAFLFVVLASTPLALTTPAQASLVYDVNVVVNGDAEAGPASPNSSTFVAPVGWTNSSLTDGVTATQYGAPSGYPNAATPGPADRGNNFFGGTISAETAFMTQLLDVSNEAGAIDTGLVSYDLSAYLGGFLTHRDYAVFSVAFQDASNAGLGTVSLGPVTVGDRGSVTEFLFRSTIGYIPATTRSLLFRLDVTRFDGTNGDGYADNLIFIAHAPATSEVPLPAALPLFASAAGGLGYLGWRRRRRAG